MLCLPVEKMALLGLTNSMAEVDILHMHSVLGYWLTLERCTSCTFGTFGTAICRAMQYNRQYLTEHISIFPPIKISPHHSAD